jgi:WD40 repeat protein
MSPDGATFATGSNNSQGNKKGPGDIRLWDAHTGQLKRTFTHEFGIASITYSRDGAVRASSDLAGFIRLTDAKTGKVLRQWQGRLSSSDDYFANLRLSADGRLVAASHTSDSHEGEVVVWAIR